MLFCGQVSLNRAWLSVIPRTVARQAPLSMGFSREAYWSGLLCPPPGDLPDPGIEPMTLMSSALAAGSSPLVLPAKPFKQHPKEPIPY